MVHPKDNIVRDKTGTIYKITCDNCDRTYIGESDRSLHRRINEHLAINRSSLTAVAEHNKNNKHTFSWDNVEIVGRENNTLKRKIREAIEIKILKPEINRDVGYELPKAYEPLWSRDFGHRKSRDGRPVDSA